MQTHPIKLRIISLLLAFTVLFTSCASSTLLQSNPPGANVYLNNEPVGKTPYIHTDNKIIWSKTKVKLTKDGYETLHSSFSRNEEFELNAIIGGILFMVPFLWLMKYKPLHKYELVPLTSDDQQQILNKQYNLKSKVERIREFKQLLDENIITKKEFEKEKKKILEEDEK